MANAIFARRSDYILTGATITGTAPSTSYSLSTLGTLNPAARVRFGSGTVTVTFTLGVAAKADLFALPAHNLSGSVLTLTNGSGLSQTITLPTLPPDNIPLTTIVDLTIGTPSAVTRTATVWNLVIVGNAANVILGGAVWLSTPNRTFNHNFEWGGSIERRHRGIETVNDYGTAYPQDYETVERWIDCTFPRADVTDRASLHDWYLANHGRWTDSIFWPDPSVNDALLGRWSEAYAERFKFTNNNQIPLRFDERPKGKPLV